MSSETQVYNLVSGSATGTGWAAYGDATLQTGDVISVTTSDTDTNDINAILTAPFPVTSGKSYTLTADVKATANFGANATGMVSLSVGIISVTGIKLATDWSHVSVELTPSKDASDARVAFLAASSDGSPASLYVRDLMLVEGTTPAAWAPAEGESLAGGGALMSANLLDGVTPKLMSGTTKEGGVWHHAARPSADSHDDWLGFGIGDQPALSENQLFHVGISARAASASAAALRLAVSYVDAAGNSNRAVSDPIEVGASWARTDSVVVVPSGMTPTGLYVEAWGALPETWMASPTLSYTTQPGTNVIGNMGSGDGFEVGDGGEVSIPSRVSYWPYCQRALSADRTMYVSGLVSTEGAGGGKVTLGVSYRDSAGNTKYAIEEFGVSGQFAQVGGKVVVPSGAILVGAVVMAVDGSPVVHVTSLALYDGDRTPAAKPSPTFGPSYWNRRIALTRYRFAVVSRASGMEIDPDLPVVHGGTITRNDDTRIKESAEVELMDSYDFGPNLVRVFLDAEWDDGATVEVPLGTFIPVVPSRSVSNGRSKHSVKMYGRLQELLDDSFSSPVTVPSGTNAVAYAASVCRGVGLEVIADASDYVTTNVRMYGVGADQNNSEVGTTKLDCVNDLLSLAGFRAAMTDEMGRVLLRRYRDPADMPIAWSFVEGPSAKFVGEFDEERDYTSAANHVVVRYGSLKDGTGKVVVGEAWDTDPASDLSTVRRGRTITSAYTYQDLPEGKTDAEMTAYANARAKTLLATAQSIIRRETFTHAYAPVCINQAISIDFPTGGVSGRFQVRTQTIRLVGGCPIQCEARIFRRRVNG